MTPLQLFVRGCRQRLLRFKIADSTGGEMTGGELLTASLVMRRLLRSVENTTPEQSMMGVLLPPSVGAVLANIGIGLSGRVAVNLNYGFTALTLNRCIEQCDIKYVLTSHRFVERRPLQLKAEFIYLEDLKAQATWIDKLIAAAQAYLLPVPLLERLLHLLESGPDDLLAILFTSGTTGDPKGVMLSMNNIASSIDAIRRTYRTNSEDVTLGILPFFHAFGYSATLWLPLAMDMAVVYHFDPFGTKAIGRIARRFHATVLYATPTFLRLYVRRCSQQDLESIDVAIVGAEKLDAELATAFDAKFQATAVEGYGTTELSPWAAANVPAHRSLADDGRGNKSGTVGRALPGVSTKVIDPDTHEVLGTGQTGLLLIRGPNVMLGYWKNPEKTAEVIRDGWYNTGDFAQVDDEGFIEITGRQSRFSKIGGETVPHETIENLMAKIIRGDDESDELHRIAITAVPDSKKGERLIAVYQSLGGQTPDTLISQLSAQGLPNLWIPHASDFIQIPEIPLTSVGKVDFGTLKRVVAEAG